MIYFLSYRDDGGHAEAAAAEDFEAKPTIESLGLTSEDMGGLTDDEISQNFIFAWYVAIKVPIMKCENNRCSSSPFFLLHTPTPVILYYSSEQKQATICLFVCWSVCLFFFQFVFTQF